MLNFSSAFVTKKRSVCEIMNETMVKTGKASIDRPWMQYYPEFAQHLEPVDCSVMQYLRDHCPGEDAVALHYYGSDILWNDLYARVDEAAKALKAAGFGVNDQIPVMLASVPEFIVLLLAAEKIGACVLCRDNTLEENVEAVVKSGAKTIFVHDFFAQFEWEAYKAAGVERAVLISPYCSADRAQIPEHIEKAIRSKYPEEQASGEGVVSWEDFLKAGEGYEGEVEAAVDSSRELLRAYTSGSTGTSKQVIHSAKTMLGCIHQLGIYGTGDFRPTWLHTILPPALVAATVSMLLLPLASNKLLILSPFVEVEDLDLEMMRYRPNCWPLIPMFLEVLMRSERIPADYDMSHLFAVGVGCEAFNNGQVIRADKFLHDHNCRGNCTVGFGQSEAGSSCMFPCPAYPVENGNIGIPLPMNTMAVFKPGTDEELGYNEIGEVCVTGPALMMGYDNEEATGRCLIKHSDGRVWLHCDDSGYVNPDGVFYLLGRGYPTRVGGGYLSEVVMENRVVDAKIEGIKDVFFVNIPDRDNEGHFVPYAYVVLEEGYELETIREAIVAALEEYQRPVEIFQLPERPFFHFKTNRVGLSRELMAK